MRIRKRFLYFCFAGASGAILELISFNLFFLFFEFSISKILSLILALTLNFTLNRNITFSANSGRIRIQSIRYIVTYSIAIAFNFFVSLTMNSLLGSSTLNANIAAASGILAAVPITFLGSLYWVFK